MDFITLALAKKYTDEQTFTIKSEHVFADFAARDAYFTANPLEKTMGLYVAVGSSFQRWDSSTWINITAIVKGNDGAEGKSAYEIWLQAGNTGTTNDFLASITAGLIDFYTAGSGGVNGGQVVFVTTTNTVQAANSSNVTHAGRIVGIASATTAESDTVRVQKAGSIICPVWNLTPGNIYYLGAGGDIASTPPTTGFVQKIGVAETSTKLVIQIEPAILLN